MGSVSSVYVTPQERNISHGDPEQTSENHSNLDIEIVHEDWQENFQNRQHRNSLEIRVCHSYNRESKDTRESELGTTIQYLAEENARLASVNKDLSQKVEMTKEPEKVAIKDVEIYGETSEQRQTRLEKTLESERMEKWKAIENSEKTRVDLVNCERELAAKNEENERIQKELSHCRDMISVLEQRLKRDEVEEPSEPRRNNADLEAFKEDLMAKRMLRQNALAAVSLEIRDLREELRKEKALRVTLQEQLHSGDTTGHEPTEEIKILRVENEELKGVTQKFEKELRSLKTFVSKLKKEYADEKMMHERTSKEKKLAEREKEEKDELLRKMEVEKEKMWEDYDREKFEVNKRTTALKEVVEISKQMLVIRESQVKELKRKLQEIEESVSSTKLPDQKNLKEEYEKQLQNIKTLKELYEERVRLMEMERDKLNETITQHNKTIEGQKGEIESLKEQCGTVSEELKKERYQNDSLERDLRISIARSKDFENELSLINNLFTQMLLGPYNTGNETDLDKLTELLQENHDLITELTLRENSSEIASALPKLLLDLITQVDGNKLMSEQGKEQDSSEMDTLSEQSDTVAEGAVLPILSYKKAIFFEDTTEAEDTPKGKAAEPTKTNEHMNPAVQEIASNLPKVWRVLMELLSHHTVPDGPPPGDENQCYKNIETPSGTRSVISVSNTFIRLKDLILEKKALEKELLRLKKLNSHLENRLDDQEKRLSHVQCELHKTWGIVGRMRAQHQQLHNHERILRYELQEKRVMLSELKQELEYCRDKWERARQKNDESESQWQKLRREFAARKNKNYATSNLNDSGESGFSDELNESGEEGENFDTDRSSTQSPVDRKPEEQREESIEREKSDEASASAEEAASSEPSDQRLMLQATTLGTRKDGCELLEDNVDNVTLECHRVKSLEEPQELCGSAEGRELSEDVKTDDATAARPDSKPERTVEEILNARSERLRRLEEQCQTLVGKMTNTVQRGADLSNKLEDLHIEYLNSEQFSQLKQEIRNGRTASVDESGQSRVPEEGNKESKEGKENRTGED